MQFLYPAFLWGLLALAIPVIIHLFFFRRFKKVYFTNVRFLKEVKEETSARQKLRNLLVLAMRMLAIAFLVFAFSQPFIPQDMEVTKGRQAISVFIDNSFSMSALGADLPLLEKAKIRAGEIVEAYQPEDQFQVLTHDFEGRHQRLVSQEDALSLIEEIRIGPTVRNLSVVFGRQKQVLDGSGLENKTAYQISDFQSNISDIDQLKDSLISVELIPLQAVQERNISIDTAWFDAPVQMLNQPNTLLVVVRNHSQEPAENIRLSVKYEGQTKPVGTLNIPARASVTDTVPITIINTGWHQGELAITDFPVQFDDRYFFAFHVAEQINILCINDQGPNAFLEAAFRGIPYFRTVNQNSKALEYSGFPDFQLIILNDLREISSGLASELRQFVSNGGNLLVFPGKESVLSGYREFLQSFPASAYRSFQATPREVGEINTREFIFSDVFEKKGANLKLPRTQGNYLLDRSAQAAEENILTYRDGQPFILKNSYEEGNLFLCSAPLNEDLNNLVRNSEIFIPMMYKMAIATATSRQIAHTIGKETLLETESRQRTGAETVYKLAGPKGEFIPEQRTVASRVFLGVADQVEEAGIYDLFLDPGEILAQFAFNYDRSESDLTYLSEEALSGLATASPANINVVDANSKANFTELIGERAQGIVLWRWCLVLVLVFLGIEGLLLRLWRT